MSRVLDAGELHIQRDVAQAEALALHEQPPKEDESIHPEQGDVPAGPEGPPHTVAGGAGAPRQATTEQTAASQSQATKLLTRELRKLPNIADRGPDRLHLTYHIVLSETRGNARDSFRTVPVGIKPVQILGKDEDRHVVHIICVSATADGSFVAIGDDQLQSFSWDPTTGQPPVPNVFLFPVTAPFVYKIEHVREVFACFVPNPSVQAAGQTAILSLTAEFGDAALRKSSPAFQPGPVDR
jgi:hypothetical protein